MLPTATNLFRDELGPGETILWNGQPKQGLLLRTADVVLIPFSLLWGGFVILWESAAVVGEAPLFFALWGIPFVLAGLYLIFGRFFMDARQRQKTYYALTNERVIILSGILGHTTRTVNLKTLADISLNLKKDGQGTITFGPTHPMGWWYAGLNGWPGMNKFLSPAFEQIVDARRVYDLIRKAQLEE